MSFIPHVWPLPLKHSLLLSFVVDGWMIGDDLAHVHMLELEVVALLEVFEGQTLGFGSLMH